MTSMHKLSTLTTRQQAVLDSVSQQPHRPTRRDGAVLAALERKGLVTHEATYKVTFRYAWQATFRGELNTSKARAERVASVWNSKHPVGTAVILRMDSEKGVQTHTRTPAQVSNSGEPICWFEGVSGYYLLDRATPVVQGEEQQ